MLILCREIISVSLFLMHDSYSRTAVARAVGFSSWLWLMQWQAARPRRPSQGSSLFEFDRVPPEPLRTPTPPSSAADTTSLKQLAPHLPTCDAAHGTLLIKYTTPAPRTCMCGPPAHRRFGVALENRRPYLFPLRTPQQKRRAVSLKKLPDPSGPDWYCIAHSQGPC